MMDIFVFCLIIIVYNDFSIYKTLPPRFPVGQTSMLPGKKDEIFILIMLPTLQRIIYW